MIGKFMSRKQQLRHKKRQVHRGYWYNMIVGDIEVITTLNCKEYNLVESEYHVIDGNLTHFFLSEDDAK